MKFSRKVYLPALCALTGVGLWADLSNWVRFVDLASNLESVFFKTLSVPGGPVAWRRSPRESREELTKVIGQTPGRSELYSLRALEAERQLDFSSAETDWNKYTELSASNQDAWVAKSDYHHRRLESQKELEALRRAISLPTPAQEAELPAEQQSAWKLAQRTIQIVQDQDLGVEAAVAQYRGFLNRYPSEAALYSTFGDYLLSQQRWNDFTALTDSFEKTFPKDQAGLLRLRARLEKSRGLSATALALYDKSFRPDWESTSVFDYFQLIKETKSQRPFLAAARNRLQSEPGNIDPVGRLFYYYQQQGNLAAGRRILLEYRQRKESRKLAWTADELHWLAQWFEASGDVPEAAKLLYSEYALNPNSERALVNLTRLIVDAADQPIRFGQGDLSLYRDIGIMDPHPGFWNGILSLLLNRQNLDMEMSQQEDKSVAYFHHAKAAELIALLDQRFPNSSSRPELHASLIDAYGRHGATASVLSRGRLFLNTFKDSPHRVSVALLMAGSHASKKETQAEFAIYDELLSELATKAGNRPLGTVADGQPKPLRSPDYVRVLDRYIAGLVALKRMPDALALYRRELDRNPNDPALYERLAAFFEQNKFGADAEAVYRRALTQFPDTSWHHRLARFLLRQKQNQKVAVLTNQVTKVFAGSDLERYFAKAFEAGPLDPQLFLQVNTYANLRFPHHIQFVKNLLNAYSATGTAKQVAWEKLMRANWHYDAGLRDQFFAYLSRTGKLDAELAALRTANPATPAELVKSNPAALYWMAEAEAWRSHYETAAPMLLAMADEQPADLDISGRTVAMHRSLSAFDPPLVLKALSVQEKLQRAYPGDEGIATVLGEISADREWFYKAKPVWNKMPGTAPGRSELYLNAATVFWDYYQYDDALRLLAEGRKRLKSQAMFGFESGAIHENNGDMAKAISEYRKAVLLDQDSKSRSRLVRLGLRPQWRDAIEAATSQPVSDLATTTIPALQLRAGLLNAQSRRDDLGRLATAIAARTSDWEMLDHLRQLATDKGFEELSLVVIDRQVSLNDDPLEKISLRLQKARLEENLGRTQAATTSMDELYRENPLLLGIVRSTVDYHWRGKNYERAVNVLVEASAKAWPGLGMDLRLEAVDKAAKSNQFALGGRIADALLVENPLDARCITAKSDLLSRQNDSRGLAAFYQQKITEAKGNASLVASFRRGLIPALTRMNDFAGATEQYVQLINQFPDDSALVVEAAQFATARNEVPRMKSFYAKAETDSPRDHRWAIVTARLETAWENQSASLDAYTRALRIRPERVDLWTAKASLEERLRRWDDLAATYTKLYDLSYKNASYLERAAEVRARQGRNDEAEKILRQALIDGRPAAADNYFAAARDLAKWNMTAKAVPLWEAGFPLLAQSADANLAAREYGAAMTKLRRAEEALTKLKALAPRADQAIYEAVLRSGLEGISDAVGTFYTPEELTRFATWLPMQSNIASPVTLAECARRAKLQDVASRIEFAYLQSKPGSEDVVGVYRTFVDNQRSRLQFEALGQQLETYSRLLKNETVNQVLDDAKRAYNSAGNEVAELRILLRMSTRSNDDLARMIELLNRRDPQRLATMINAQGEFDSFVANVALRDGNAALTARALSRTTRQPVWRDFYRALAGVYFADASPAVETLFRTLLGSELIGERLARRPDPNLNLTGDSWYFMAARLGEYRGDMKRQGSEDYPAAMVEQNPSIGQSHEDLADYYQSHGKPAEALDSYQRAITWNGQLTTSKIRAAALFAKQGKKDESLKLIQAAMDSMRSQNIEALPELLAAVTEAGFGADLKTSIESLLALSMKRNGSYAVQPMLPALLKLYQTAPQLAAAVITITRGQDDQARVLFEFGAERIFAGAPSEQLFKEAVRLAQGRLGRSYGPEKDAVAMDVARYQIALMRRLLEGKRPREAQQILDTWTEEQRRAEEALSLDLQVAAALGSLPTKLGSFGNKPPELQSMRNAALELRRTGYAKEALTVLDFAYTKALASGSKDTYLYLDLAGTKLEQSDVAGALTLLRRMTMVSSDGAESYSLAADLLISRNRPEAAQFLKSRLDFVPWDMEAKRKLAQLEKNGVGLVQIAKNTEATYQTRLEAADWLGKNAKQVLSSASSELDQIAAANITAAEQPYALALRIAGSETGLPTAQLRLLTSAAAIAPGDPRLNLLLAKAVALAGDSRLASALADRFAGIQDAATLAGIAKLLDGPPALPFWKNAIALAKLQNPDWIRGRRLAEAKVAAQAQNDIRRPLVASGLEQNRVVRPRLKPEQLLSGMEEQLP